MQNYKLTKGGNKENRKKKKKKKVEVYRPGLKTGVVKVKHQISTDDGVDNEKNQCGDCSDKNLIKHTHTHTHTHNNNNNNTHTQRTFQV